MVDQEFLRKYTIFIFNINLNNNKIVIFPVNSFINHSSLLLS